jgi:hypothetical protein
MAAKAGDRIVVTAKTKRLAPRQRGGVIEDVLDPDQPRYLVRWDDGRTSVITPLAGTVTVERARKRAAKETPPKPVKGTPARVRLRSAPKKTKVRKK